MPFRCSSCLMIYLCSVSFQTLDTLKQVWFWPKRVEPMCQPAQRTTLCSVHVRIHLLFSSSDVSLLLQIRFSWNLKSNFKALATSRLGNVLLPHICPLCGSRLRDHRHALIPPLGHPQWRNLRWGPRPPFLSKRRCWAGGGFREQLWSWKEEKFWAVL